ncbi:MAG: SDR family oxidoreductase [Acidobacteriota bacterium]|nr:SDR family oxidoreductase [Blastocatellia bacterium]MDW8412216.1 SDR family oxidoreductase [Acidobacteriota bacterium]
MKVLVTGGAGFIGSHIVDRLLLEGHKVRILDNFSTGSRNNFPLEKVELIEGDIRDRKIVYEAVEGVDAVLHQAALGSVPRSIVDPATTHEINVTGTLNLLIAAKEAKVKRFVYASSSSVYGNSEYLPKEESMSARPLSPYALSKLAGESYTILFYKLYGFSTIALRYFNVFGPRQEANSEYAAVIPRFTEALLAGNPITIYGDGLQTRDFTYVDNVVEANLLALNSTVSGEICNIACGQSYSILELIANLSDLTQTCPKIIYKKPRPGDVRNSFASISKAIRLLGFRPRVTFIEGLKLTVDWFRQKKVAEQLTVGTF